MHHFSWATAVAALLSVGSVKGSVPAQLAQETSVGLMADMGMSPMPTHPPGVPRGYPRELLPRQAKTTLPIPAPGYYCGLVNGDPENLLTCVNARANCVHQDTAIGCCISSQISECTNIPSSCINYGDPCDGACQENKRILKCTVTTEPYCGTYFFGGGSRLFGCRSLASVTSQVQQLTEYYASVYGPSYTTKGAGSSLGLPSATPSSSRSRAETTSRSTSSKDPFYTTSPIPSPTPPPEKSGLGGGAVAGIAVGSCAAVAAVAAFLVWFCCVKKKRDDANQSNLTTGGPAGGIPPPVGGGYEHAQPNTGNGYYAPVPQDNKPLDHSQPPPSYGYDKPPQQPQPDMAEMLGSTGMQGAQQLPQQGVVGGQAEMPGSPGLHPQPAGGQAAEYYNQQRVSMGPPSPLSAGGMSASTTTPGSPNNGMHPTHAGPVPEQIYEMGPTR